MRRRSPRARNRFAALKTFAEFWRYEAIGSTCCLLCDDEAADEDPEIFECETCAVAAALATLDPDNRAAWNLYRKVITRLSSDIAAGGVVLERLTREISGDDFDAMWRRLGILYEAMNPPPAQSQEE